MAPDIHDLPTSELQTLQAQYAQEVQASQHRIDHGGAFFDTIEYEEFMEGFQRERKRLREVDAELATRDDRNQLAPADTRQPGMSPAHAAPYGSPVGTDPTP